MYEGYRQLYYLFRKTEILPCSTLPPFLQFRNYQMRYHHDKYLDEPSS